MEAFGTMCLYVSISCVMVHLLRLQNVLQGVPQSLASDTPYEIQNAFPEVRDFEPEVASQASSSGRAVPAHSTRTPSWQYPSRSGSPDIRTLATTHREDNSAVGTGRAAYEVRIMLREAQKSVTIRCVDSAAVIAY